MEIDMLENFLLSHGVLSAQDIDTLDLDNVPSHNGERLSISQKFFIAGVEADTLADSLSRSKDENEKALDVLKVTFSLNVCPVATRGS